MNDILQNYKHYRFIKQRDTYSCGPVAIINMFKFLGLPIKYKDLKQVSKDIGTVKPNQVVGIVGSSSHIIDEFLIENKLVKTKSYKHGYSKENIIKIERHLNAGNCCLINLYWNNSGNGHYFVIVGHTKDKFVVVNFYKNKTISLVDKKLVSKYMKNSITNAEGWHPSCVWFINAK